MRHVGDAGFPMDTGYTPDQPEPKRHIFKIDDGETHWYSAVSAEAVIDLLAKEYGYDNVADYREDLSPEIEQVDDGHMLRVRYEGAPLGEEVVEQTCRQWADQVDGAVASTCW